MPLEGIINTARALSYWERLQEVTANNVANANTDAFKADRVIARSPAGENHPVPVQAVDLSQGPLRDTGRPLDLALDGPGYFVARTERGERLVRGGSLRLDADARITDVHGQPLLGEEGPIVVTGSDLDIHPDGTVIVDGAVAGRLRIENVDEPATLLKEGYGRFVPRSPLRAVDEGQTRVRQRAVEESNLDPLTSMVDLVTIQRAYATNIEALRAMDSVLGVIAGDVGRV